MSFLTLPSELHFNIIEAIDCLHDIYKLVLTCRRFANLYLPTLQEAARSDVGQYTALQWASRNGHEGLVRFLLREGVPIDHHTRITGTALHYAIDGPNAQTIVSILLEHGADITIPHQQKATTLHAAATAGDETVVKMLLDRGLLDVNSFTIGRTPLYDCCASHKPNPEIARLLLLHGADLEFPIEITGGARALHMAAANKAASARELVKVLLAHGANIEAVNNYQQTPLHYAADMGTVAVLEALLQHGADVSAIDYRGLTPLHTAAQGTCADMCEMLLQYGAELTAKDGGGLMPINRAAIGAESIWRAPGHNYVWLEATLKVLLSRGAGAYPSHTLDGQLLLWAVKNTTDEGILRMILEHGVVDINMRDTDGWTPLHWAARFGMVDIVKMLLDCGADAAVMAKGKTALALAAARGEDGVVEVLMRVGGKGVLGRRVPPPMHGSTRGVVMAVEDVL